MSPGFRRPALAIIGGSIALATLLPSVSTFAASGTTSKTDANKDLLVLSDFPKGWVASKGTVSNPALPGSAQLASCLGVSESVVTSEPPKLYSPAFKLKSSQLSAQDDVSTYPTAKAAQADVDLAANPRTPACFSTILNGPLKAQLVGNLSPGESVGNILVSRTTGSRYASGGANLIVFIPLTVGSETANLQLSTVVYTKGKLEQTIILTSVQGAFPEELSKHLTTVAKSRI
jgi:hypothetical protein